LISDQSAGCGSRPSRSQRIVRSGTIRIEKVPPNGDPKSDCHPPESSTEHAGFNRAGASGDRRSLDGGGGCNVALQISVIVRFQKDFFLNNGKGLLH